MAWKGGRSVGVDTVSEEPADHSGRARSSRASFRSGRTGLGIESLQLAKADLAVGMLTGINPNQVDFRSPWTFSQIGLQTKAITGATVITVADPYAMYVCGGSGVYSVFLPAAASCTNRLLIFKRTNASNNVTIDGNASENIDGATTKVLSSQYDSIMIVCDGTGWHIISSNP